MDNKDKINGFDGFDSAEPKTEAENVFENTTPNPKDFVLKDEPTPIINLDDEPKERSTNNIFSGNYGEDNSYSYTPPTKPTPPPVYYSPKPPKPPKAPKEKRQFGLGTVIATSLICSVLVCTAFSALFLKNAKGNNISPTPTTSNSEQKIVNIEGSIEQLAAVAAEKASGSVVGVQTTYAVQSFFSGQSTTSGSGSGVIYKSDGYIITNYHVISDALEARNSTITVFLDNDTEEGFEAKVINYNISCDLAVLKIDKQGLDAIDIGKADDLKVGQYVVAIGSPAGLEFMGSTSFGIISGLNRKISTTTGEMTLIQTDAAINPGNSGGALVNSKGELIGISSSKLVDTSFEGMGFAIPVDTVVSICDDLIAHEGAGDAYTGISISSNYTARVLEYYGYPVGAVVASVDSGSPAESAGLQRGDIITKFGETDITEYTFYETALANHFPGDKVEVTYYRGGKTYTTTITIGSVN